jgi:hypothetical protein
MACFMNLDDVLFRNPCADDLIVFLLGTLIFFSLADQNTRAQFFPYSPTKKLPAKGANGHFHALSICCCVLHTYSPPRIQGIQDTGCKFQPLFTLVLVPGCPNRRKQFKESLEQGDEATGQTQAGSACIIGD